MTKSHKRKGLLHSLFFLITEKRRVNNIYIDIDIAILNESWKYKAYNKGLKPLVSPQIT